MIGVQFDGLLHVSEGLIEVSARAMDPGDQKECVGVGCADFNGLPGEFLGLT